MRYIILFIFGILYLVPPFSKADSNNDSNLIGRGVLKYYLWDVYEASLFSEAGEIEDKKEFSLVLKYFLDIEGEKIANRSIEEMKRLGCVDNFKLERWYTNMKNLFPNVRPGVQLKGIRHADGRTSFYRDDEFLGEINDDKFTECFFGIWLSEKSSEPELRRKLLGREK